MMESEATARKKKSLEWGECTNLLSTLRRGWDVLVHLSSVRNSSNKLIFLKVRAKYEQFFNKNTSKIRQKYKQNRAKIRAKLKFLFLKKVRKFDLRHCRIVAIWLNCSRKILEKTLAGFFLCLFMFIIDPSFWFFNLIAFSWLEMNLKKMARANGKMP